MIHNWQTLFSAEGLILGWVCAAPPARVVHRSATALNGAPRAALPADPHPERCPGCRQRILINSEDIPARFNLNDMVAS